MSTDGGTLGGHDLGPAWNMSMYQAFGADRFSECTKLEEEEFQDTMRALHRGVLWTGSDSDLERARRLFEAVEQRKIIFTSRRDAYSIKIRLQAFIFKAGEIKNERAGVAAAVQDAMK